MIPISNMLGCGGMGGFDGMTRLTSETYHLSNTVYNAKINSMMFLDTRAGEFGINFPLNPEPGNVIILTDIGGNLTTEPVRLYNLKKLLGETLIGTAPDFHFLLRIPYVMYTFVFVNADIGWIYYKNSVHS